MDHENEEIMRRNKEKMESGRKATASQNRPRTATAGHGW
jgi:hypothetical protein